MRHLRLLRRRAAGHHGAASRRGLARGDADAETLFRAFAAAWPLHELLWYLRAALAIPAAAALAPRLAAAYEETDALVLRAATLARGDVQAQRERVNELLREASALVRAPFATTARDHRGADLGGQDLRGQDLRGAELRGAVMIAADLRGVDLALADLTGADLRAADIRGADLARALFVTPSQLRAARGDAATRIPAGQERPPHWA